MTDPGHRSMNEQLSNANSRVLHAPFSTVLATQTADQAFRWVTAVLSTQSSSLRSSNAHLVAYTGSNLALEWFEMNVASPVSSHWGSGAALAGAPWPRIEAWLGCGGPRMLMALDALIAYRKPAANMAPLAQIAAPVLPQAPGSSRFEQAVLGALKSDSTPRIKSSVEAVLRYSDEILRCDSRKVAVEKLPLLFLDPKGFENAEPILDQQNSVISAFRKSIEALKENGGQQ